MVDHSAEHSFGCNLVTHEDDGWKRVIRSGARTAPRRPLPTIGDVLMAKGFTKGFKVLMDEDGSKSIDSENDTLFANNSSASRSHTLEASVMSKDSHYNSAKPLHVRSPGKASKHERAAYLGKHDRAALHNGDGDGSDKRVGTYPSDAAMRILGVETPLRTNDGGTNIKFKEANTAGAAETDTTIDAHNTEGLPLAALVNTDIAVHTSVVGGEERCTDHPSELYAVHSDGGGILSEPTLQHNHNVLG